jgi:probable phosphoglycerate mutase
VTASRLWLVRHGETEWSATGKHTGSTDVPLTEAGRAAASALAKMLADQSYALVLTSPLSRARDTCALAGLGDHAVVTEDLREWDYGEYEGLTTAEIRKRVPSWTVFTNDCPGGETPEQVAARADRVIALARDTDGEAIAFSHGHLLRVLAARWVGLPPQAGAHLALATASVSVLGWERNVPVISSWDLTLT